VTLKIGLPKRGKQHNTTCDVPGNNMLKLSGTQEVVIDYSLSEKDVPTNEEIVSNTLGSVTSIDQAHNINKNIKLPRRTCANKFSNEKRANPALDVAAPMETKREENIPTRKSSRIASYYSDCDYAKFKVSTHIASAINSDNPFVMLALDKIQDAIVDDKNPPKHM
jgi:hypothetical protein